MFIDKTVLRTAKGQSQVPALQSPVRIIVLDIVRSLAFCKEEVYEVFCLYRTQKTVYDRDMSILQRQEQLCEVLYIWNSQNCSAQQRCVRMKRTVCD